ncbi:hypothetical protein BaRGS_00033723 [Batillaria attramentaria]|uniref:Uncharacterized protein n=1 Tax=Batillaria attramentaria TaxID=370345 RepID=A0ABD0JJ44_9CAEN
MSTEGEVSETSPLKGEDKTQTETAARSRATPCSRAQAPLQSCLRPAMWFPGINRLHSHTEVWRTDTSTPQQNIESIQRALMKVIENDKTRSDFYINKVESYFLQIFVFTRAEWLDVIEMHFEHDKIKIFAFSSGFLPLFLPGACLLNVVFFWVPFLDWGMNEKRLRWLQSQLDVPMERLAA